MLAEALSYFLHLSSLVYPIFAPCMHPEQLPVSSVDQHQYLGKWFFQAAVSQRQADISKFTMFDNMVFTIEATANSTLVFTGYMRMGEACIKQNWTYYIQPGRDDLLLEGRPQRRNLLWNGAWANCRDCIIFQEVEPRQTEADSVDSLNRFMLYVRQKDSASEVVTAFLRNSACHNLKQSVRLPHHKEYCA
ncbi:PREDICTED: apolipoprotein M [Cyprinodon variegatus]|nr:PREDICTED: apolipoprotein M [Cyprinodon variegatus]